MMIATRLDSPYSTSSKCVVLGCRRRDTIAGRQREVAVGDREQDGVGAATVSWIGRVLSRTYLAPSAQDGWSFGGRGPDAHPRSSPRRAERARVLPGPPLVPGLAAGPRRAREQDRGADDHLRSRLAAGTSDRPSA